MPRMKSNLALLAAFVLLFSPTLTRAADDHKPIKVLLVLGGCCHDYANQQKLLSEGIAARADVDITIAYDPEAAKEQVNPVFKNPDWSKGFDVVIHDECTAQVKDLKMIDQILKPHRDGLPAVVLHCGMHSYRSEGWPDKDTPWFEFTGLITTAHRAQLPIAVHFVDKENPITKGMEDWTTVKEELYNNHRKPLPTLHPLAKGKQQDNDDVVVWTQEYGEKKTRVFGTTLGHNNDTVSDPRYLDLVTRGLLWSVDKLDDKHLKPTKAAAKAAPAPAPAVQQVASNAKSAPESVGSDCDCEPIKQ
jgi:type 1 glutamine amidotransferase